MVGGQARRVNPADPSSASEPLPRVPYGSFTRCLRATTDALGASPTDTSEVQTAVETVNSLSEQADVIDLYDRVRAPDGRVGKVIGFYRRAQVTVCVLFDSGDTGQFQHAQLSPLL